MSGIISTTEYIGSGSGVSGSVSDDIIVAGGFQIVGADYGTGTATNTTISGGQQEVGYDYGTGTATNTTIENGGGQAGEQDLGWDYGTGTAISTTISGGLQYDGCNFGTGTAISTTIDNGGLQVVGDDCGSGTAISTTINSGGTQQLADYSATTGYATRTTILSGGYQDVGFNSGTGTATRTTIFAGGKQDVGNCYGTGTASSTAISGGFQAVGISGGIGTATNTTILSGGSQVVGVDGTGTATSTTIDSGGAEYVGVYDGNSNYNAGTGTAISTTILSGGYQYVGDGSGGSGTATDTTISGGTQYVSSGGTATDTTVFSGGLMDVLSGGVADPPVIAGGTLELDEGASVGSGGIEFAAVSGANGGTLEIGSGAIPSSAISGYQADDAIVLEGLDPDYQPADPHEPLPSSFTLSLAGKALTQTNAGGSQQVTTYGITGQEFTQKAIDSNPSEQVVAKYFSGVTGQGDLSAFEYLYTAGALTGTDEFDTGIAGQAYTSEETDYDGEGRLIRAAFSRLSGMPYSSYEYDFVGGVFSGSKFTYTTAPEGASYSSYEVDYDATNAFAGEKFFTPDVTGQSYTSEEMDFDDNLGLSSVLLTGVENQAYSSLELDYSAGAYAGYKAYYTGITGQNYSEEEVDVSASGELEKVVYSGMTGTPYQTVEQDYSNGSVDEVIYGYIDVTGETYDAYQVMENVSGSGLQETFDLNSGGHTLLALASGQTLTSLGEDKMTGDGATTFVFDAIYGADIITNFNSDDVMSLPTSEFANFDAVTAAATQSGANVVITAADGDTLTLKNMTTAALAGMSSNFAFHM